MFKKAVRKNLPAKILFDGPSGTGKTYSSLLVAKGLANGGKIAGVCTENGSMSLYSDLTDFDVCDIKPPFHPNKYIKAIEFAKDSGYKVLIIDSISHIWKWAIDCVDNSNLKNDFSAWRAPKIEINKFIEKVIQSPIHIICCARSKVTHELVEKEKNGRIIKVPEKIGLKNEFQEGFDYEVDYSFNLDIQHMAECSKDRSSKFINTRFTPTIETGEEIRKWIEDGLSLQDEYNQNFGEYGEDELIEYLETVTPEGKHPTAIDEKYMRWMNKNADSMLVDIAAFISKKDSPEEEGQ